MSEYIALGAGDPAPWFRQRSFANPDYNFDVVGGRYVVLCYFASASDAHSQAALAAVAERSDLFDDDFASFFGISVDPSDESEQRVEDSYPGYRFFWDFDCKIARAYGVLPGAASDDGTPMVARRMWFVLDPTLRIMQVVPFADDGSDIAMVVDFVSRLPRPHQFAGFEVHAPILILPQVFEPEFCRHLIDLYDEHGGEESGFMRQRDGKTVGVKDRSHKSRKDYYLDDQALIKQTQTRMIRRVVPEIRKVHQFHVTRMERYLVGCYSADDGGHFAPHRDNTTSGTAHRRFAVSINLNDDFDGGEVGFPEYGPRRYKAPPGGAVVFSCSLLHSVSRVTRGARYAFLPFLYDDAAAAIREQNNKFLAEGVGAYTAEPTARGAKSV
jgi:peroxiredoxin/predicted 2-oxoglutarate/Fe(II)-dependent dioxygenase YbiX